MSHITVSPGVQRCRYVPDAREVLPEAYELVDKGLLSAADFRGFVCDHAIRLHGGMNPDFFEGTSVAAHAKEVLHR